MKIDARYRLRETAGLYILLDRQSETADLTRIVTLNDSARLLWQRLQKRQFTEADAAAILTEHYGLSPQQAAADARKWTALLLEHGLAR